MRDQFNLGLSRMCESGDYEELLVEYGVEQQAEDSKVICDTATAGTSDGAGITVLFSTAVVSFAVVSMVMFW